jgi:predicted MFS family arabinose efflux permease
MLLNVQSTASPPPPTAARTLRRDLVWTFASFTLSGVLAGTWFSRIPAVRDHLHADLRTVGLVLVCMGLGSFTAMSIGGVSARTFGTARVCGAASTGACVLFPVLTLIGDVRAFAAVLFVAGGCFGMWEVMLNVHGAEVERASGRSIMPALHGFWSGGLIAGSGLGALLASQGVSLGTHFWSTLPVVLALNLAAVGRWHDHRVAHDVTASAPARRPKPSTRAVTAPIALLAVMLICSNIGEGSASDWLELYAHDDRGFRPGLAAAVFTTYTVAITIGRLLGGPVITRLGRVVTLRLCGLLTCAGLACTLHMPTTAGPYVGAALWGLGLSVVFPMAITAAGEHGRDNSAGAISAVSTMGYGAFLTGPPVIGLLAQDWSIGAALHLVMALSLGITLLAWVARPAPRARSTVGPGHKPPADVQADRLEPPQSERQATS